MFSSLKKASRDAQVRNQKPEFFRLPKSGTRDPYFGLPRTTYYELEKAGLIRLIRLRKRGRVRGTTLIPFDEVHTHLRDLAVSQAHQKPNPRSASTSFPQ
jgi:hypothetical protein